MKTWKMQDGDIVISDGRIIVIDGRDALRQRLMNALKLDRGGWYFDATRGIPWFNIYNGKYVNERYVRSQIQRVLASDSEVKNISYINIVFEKETRTLKIEFEVDSIYGSVGGMV